MKIITLGEIMLRLSTSSSRIINATSFDACYGGGEANVAISLANFGHETYFMSAVPNNFLGEAVKQHLHTYQVSTEYLLEEGERLGTYYLENGHGNRSSQVIYDRAGSSFATIKQLAWNLEGMFDQDTLFHISGIVPALSKEWQQLTLEIITAAKSSGATISFDSNYRSKLWSQKEAGHMMKQILPLVDYCSLGILDAKYLLEVIHPDEEVALGDCYKIIQSHYPNLKVMYSTKRIVKSTNHHQLTGYIFHQGELYQSKEYDIDEVVDRVGAGDAFAAGVLHGLLQNYSYQETIDFATAASVLKHTVFGDCNQFSASEVSAFSQQEVGKINR
ncbi:2-dehydro-3-deoxygluconokinase [Granulicatella balaenopterae]|uniref:2-dehydro-3-deoxygluconokinase n=1 Tax=Granulicatella balaenopterae TaxID=137733 RepID=A0A1H9LWN6_9LACT|nr:sugar kinase [Granulicatella balaenopterae]SER15679.1 2-dehydro-3-deoxygluconokinase [Granulicatella balaenopterae]